MTKAESLERLREIQALLNAGRDIDARCKVDDLMCRIIDDGRRPAPTPVPDRGSCNCYYDQMPCNCGRPGPLQDFIGRIPAGATVNINVQLPSK